MKEIETELSFRFVQASGPGGQNINKVASAVQLRFDILQSPSLNEDVKLRLKIVAGRRVTKDGILTIEARRYRSQEENRLDVLERFRGLLQQALMKPASRKRTKPSLASKEKRLGTKKKRGALKRLRNKSTDSE